MKGEALSGDVSMRDDQLLWRAFQTGDRLAFESMYRDHIQQLIRYGFKISGEEQIVQDCIQDLFMELWDSRESLAEVKSVRHYLLKSLRYKIVRYLRQSNSEDLEKAGYYADDDHFERSLLEREAGVVQSRRLYAALEMLPKRQKEAIHLRYFEQMSNEEVADLMGVNYQSACKFIYTALKNLRDVMLILFCCFKLFIAS